MSSEGKHIFVTGGIGFIGEQNFKRLPRRLLQEKGRTLRMRVFKPK
jgi:nucleoside-diphosphate-sugar epimerase